MTAAPDRLEAALASRYTIQRELGSGGMATVYLAEDVKHERNVAIKVLRPELAAALGADRFLREIKITARLQHPHILTLLDSGEADGFLYYVMPFVDGESLRQRLEREKQLPIDEALQVAREVADALGYAHTRDVVHRDIKPENILLEAGHAVVADFGIARAISAAGGENLTETGISIGTPAYMSPEQAAGSGEVDGRSDIYSLGCVLYEMLAGEPPFTGPTVESIVHQHMTAAPRSVSVLRSAVPAEVAGALDRALAKTSADRFTTAARFAEALTGPVTSTAQSIAVLPFANMSADPENEYFTDGIAEEIVSALTKIQALRVASRTSAFAFKGKNEDIGEIGRKLKVATVLEGSVRKAGKKLRITAQLVNVADGYHLWSERYDREMEDVFAIQDEIAQNIVRALRVMLSEKEKRAIEKVRTADVQAYDYYLRGRQFFHQSTKKKLEFARQMFARAIAIDPEYAPAYAGVADCCSFLYMRWDAREANLEEADATSRRALAIEPELAESHASRGLAVSLSKRYDEAQKEFETAIRLNPKLFEAHYFYARACFQQGKLEEAVRLFEQACHVRPEDYQAPSLLALVHTALAREQEAEAAFRRALQVTETHLELNPDDARALCLGANSLAHLGEKEKSLEWVRRALAIDPEDAEVLYNVACVYANLGQHEDTITCLEKAVEHGFGHKEWIENDPDFNPVRSDRRFQALLEKV